MIIEAFPERLSQKARGLPAPSKCPFSQESEFGVKLTNFTSGKQTVDTLHNLSMPIKCTSSSCKGSLMSGQSVAPGPRTKEEILEEANKFLHQYFASLKKTTADDLQNRMNQIKAEIEQTGTYVMTYEELVFGAKLAWRNASRCIGRIQWNKLEVQDCRTITSTKEMFEALCKHLEVGTNGGNLKSMITLFPQRIPNREDFRLWNPQLINFAGYLQPDGSVIGDPGRVQLTRICQRLGWKGKGGRFDVLPWIVSAPGEGVKFYEIPEELVLMVNIEHPKYEWFAELDLKWYALPAVADMMLDVGGLSFTAAPFNGWYMATEVGARNLCDEQRYNVSKQIAERMGLDTSTPKTLWKDTVLVEITIAVLYSFQKNQVTIVDHHTAAETFMTFMEHEQKVRGGCPADWVWIVPPISGSSSPVYHQEMICYTLKPGYEYQEKAWKTYNWPQNNNVQLKYTLSTISKFVCACLDLVSNVRRGRIQVTLLYATETGKSEAFAKKVEKLLHASFNTRVICMDDYDCNELKSESFVIAIASTFGSGEPPDNGKDFWSTIKLMKKKGTSLTNLKYAVFALGSTQYPNFCNFGKNIDKLFSEMGAKRILPVELGDELKGQEHTFNNWLPEIYKTSCQDFQLEVSDEAIMPATNVNTWEKDHFRLVRTETKEKDILSEFSRLHNKKVFSVTVSSKTKLQARYSERQTLLIRLQAKDASKLLYQPGDHISIFPTNPSDVLSVILDKIREGGFNTDEVVQIECSEDEATWKKFERFPPATLKTYLSRYLDITSPPSSSFLYLLSTTAKNPWDKYRLKRLSEVTDDYEEWKSFKYPNLAEFLEEFPSIQLDPTLLVSELPLLQPRYYSISSSKIATPDEVHITVTLVSYRTQDNKGPIHYGVCTSFLNSVTESEIPCFLRSTSQFHLPEDPTAGIIMVGAGSGVAPFRSFWKEREILLQQSENSENRNFGPMYLFFGCRQSNVDNIYEHETSALVKKGVITKTFTALSREPGQPKQYVQHKLKEEHQLVLDVLSGGGHIYVCGDAVMAADVQSTIENIVGSKEKFEDIAESGRYHEDVFGVLHRRQE